MKRVIIIAVPLVLMAALGYTYYLYKNDPLFAYKNRSEQNKVCERKCQTAACESIKKCGEGCWEGAPIYAFNKTTKRCLMRSNLTGQDYYDFYVKDCNTNEYLERWNVSKKDLTTNTTSPQVENQILVKMREHNTFIDNQVGQDGEIFLLETTSCYSSG